MKNKLICITGPDGSGKSTQINILIDNFKVNGINYEYRWFRFNHFFSLPLLGFARLVGLSKVETLENGEKIGYHFFYKSKIISNIYIFLTYLDTLFSTFIKIYIPIKLLNSHIACDRFIYDILIDLMISTGNYNIWNLRIGKLFLKLIPDNSIFLMLVSDESILKARRQDVMFDKTISLKINLYREIANNFGIPIINADQSINDIKIQIMRFINE